MDVRLGVELSMSRALPSSAQAHHIRLGHRLGSVLWQAWGVELSSAWLGSLSFKGERMCDCVPQTDRWCVLSLGPHFGYTYYFKCISFLTRVILWCGHTYRHANFSHWNFTPFKSVFVKGSFHSLFYNSIFLFLLSNIFFFFFFLLLSNLIF